MARLTGGRPGFREWVDKNPDSDASLLPLTHIAKAVEGEDILRAGRLKKTHCDVFREELAYLFYGRPAYRVSNEGVVKGEVVCPMCFVFDSSLLHSARAIFAFDTGAFERRMYSHAMIEEFNVEDYSLESDVKRPNRLIHAIFPSPRSYFDADTTQILKADSLSKPWEFHARAYIQLLASTGRNEPDDRLCTIEAIFDKDINLAEHLKAVVVPHTLWRNEAKAPWLAKVQEQGALIHTYPYIPNRHPEYYQALLETAVRTLYESWELL